MKTRHIVGMALCVLCFLLCGCGAKPDSAKPDGAKIQSFTNHLQTAKTNYASSYFSIGAKLLGASEAAQSQAVRDLQRLDPSYDPMKDALKNYAKWGEAEKDGQRAMDAMKAAEADFQYIYTQFKGLPSSFREDFFRLKEMIDANIVFINTLKEGEARNSSIQKWMDDFKKSEGLFTGIDLEIKRLEK